MRTPARATVATIAGLAATAALAATALGAGRHAYVVRTLTDPAGHALRVTGPLSDLRVVSRVRVVVPTSWRALHAGAGTLRYAVASNGSCSYTVTLSVRSRLAPERAATDYVDAGLPLPAPQRLIDAGARGHSAFRVVRAASINADRVRLSGLWASILTRRADIAPKGQIAWTELHASALSRAGSECHLGTWKAALGPQIGDLMATARTDLHFID